jgi:hypothetical protein
MLDEDEFRRVATLFNTGTGNGRERLYGPMKREYQRITGAAEEVGRNICHHRLALYGPPRKACGKPLRSPRAELCGGCMAPVQKSEKVGPDVT